MLFFEEKSLNFKYISILLQKFRKKLLIVYKTKKL